MKVSIAISKKSIKTNNVLGFLTASLSCRIIAVDYLLPGLKILSQVALNMTFFPTYFMLGEWVMEVENDHFSRLVLIGTNLTVVCEL